VGINQVTVSAPGFVGQPVFSADSNAGAASQIHIVSGEVQTGAVGVALPEPLVVIVVDAGGNPVPNVPVVFTVQSGGGLINGNTAFTQNTDSDGEAYAVLVLGQQEGINNDVVTTAFVGMTGQAVGFVSSATVPGPVANTKISGVVLDNAEQPIPNATASISGSNLSALTNSQGQFTITSAPVGDLVLFIDGSTSTRTETFPTLSFQMATVPGINNNLGHPIYLPPVDTNNSQVVGGDQAVQLTMTGVPGVIYTIAPNSVTFPDGTHIGRLTLSQVHSDRVPMIPANGTAPRLVGTLQPAGVLFNPPIKMQLPNTDGLPPGQVVEIYSFRHDLEQFVGEGTARVSEDGSVLVSDPGSGLTVSGWHDIPKTSSPIPTCGDSCGACNKCLFVFCVSDSGQNGSSCTSDDPCIANAKCSSGSCNGDQKQITGLTVTATDPDNPNSVPQTPVVKVAGDNEGVYPVAFDAQADTQNCDDIQYDWDFGDGDQEMNLGATPTHNYSQAGTFTAVVTAHCGQCALPTGMRKGNILVGIVKAENVDITVHPSLNVHGGAAFPDIDFDTSGNNSDTTHNEDTHLLPMGVNAMDLECLTTPATNDPVFGPQIQSLIQWNAQNMGGGNPPTLTPQSQFAVLNTDQKGLSAVSCYLDGNQNQALDPTDSESNPFNIDLVATNVTQIQSNANQLVAQTQNHCQAGLLCVGSGGFDPTNVGTAAFWGQLSITVDDGGAGQITVPNFNYTFASNMAWDTFTANYQNGRTIKEVLVNPPATYPNSFICNGNIVFQPYPVLDDGGSDANGLANGGVSVTNSAQQDENDQSATQRVLTYVDSPGVLAPVQDICVAGNQPPLKNFSGFNQFSFYLLAFSDEFDTAYAAIGQVNSRVTYSGNVNGAVWVSNGANSTIVSRYTNGAQDAGQAGVDVYGPSDVPGVNGGQSNLRLDGRN
jgi:hypothetical protein